MGDEVGRGHFGYTCAAKVNKGSRKGESVAVKVIPKAKVMRLVRTVQCLAPWFSLFSFLVEFRGAGPICMLPVTENDTV
jgi:hypothetical protein